eukprot:68381-Pleurochrysis_carterae.AAC.1
MIACFGCGTAPFCLCWLVVSVADIDFWSVASIQLFHCLPGAAVEKPAIGLHLKRALPPFHTCGPPPLEMTCVNDLLFHHYPRTSMDPHALGQSRAAVRNGGPKATISSTRSTRSYPTPFARIRTKLHVASPKPCAHVTSPHESIPLPLAIDSAHRPWTACIAWDSVDRCASSS